MTAWVTNVRTTLPVLTWWSSIDANVTLVSQVQYSMQEDLFPEFLRATVYFTVFDRIIF